MIFKSDLHSCHTNYYALSLPFPEQVILPYNNSKTKREFGDDEVYGPFSIPYGFFLNGQPVVAYFVSIRSQHMHVLRNFLLGKYQITTHARFRNCLLGKYQITTHARLRNCLLGMSQITTDTRLRNCLLGK